MKQRRLERPDQFATTHWSLILAAGQGGTNEARRALEQLCQLYWFPLYAYARRRVSNADEAQDLTQAFFAELLEKEHVRAATPDRGRFRAFLLTAFKHFLSNQWTKARAQKRGGGRLPLSLDFAAAESRCRIEPAGGLTAEQWYDRQWAVTLLEHTMQRLEGESGEAGKDRPFRLLQPYLVGEHAGSTYASVAAELNISEGAAKMAAHRLRVRYRQLLREEIAQTVPGPEQVDDEIRQLFAILAC